MGRGSNSNSRPIGSQHSQHRGIAPTLPNKAVIVVSGASALVSFPVGRQRRSRTGESRVHN
jgi:hypothetical protein